MLRELVLMNPETLEPAKRNAIVELVITIAFFTLVIFQNMGDEDMLRGLIAFTAFGGTALAFCPPSFISRNPMIDESLARYIRIIFFLSAATYILSLFAPIGYGEISAMLTCVAFPAALMSNLRKFI